jgi:hypothetical protein
MQKFLFPKIKTCDFRSFCVMMKRDPWWWWCLSVKILTAMVTKPQRHKTAYYIPTHDTCQRMYQNRLPSTICKVQCWMELDKPCSPLHQNPWRQIQTMFSDSLGLVLSQKYLSTYRRPNPQITQNIKKIKHTVYRKTLQFACENNV